MARITSYATLATAVQEYAKKSNIGVASGNLDYFLMEVEEEMNARLRVRRMLTAVTPTVSSAGVVTLPTDFGGWKRFQVRDGTQEWDLELVAAEETTDISALYASTGTPRALVTTGSTSQIWPYTDGVYTFRGLYFARIPQLTSVATSNWVLANYPTAYLYGCLAAAFGLMSDDSPAFGARMDRWEKRFDHALRRIQREDAIDTDSRTNVVLSPNTSLFTGGSVYNGLTDDYS